MGGHYAARARKGTIPARRFGERRDPQCATGLDVHALVLLVEVGQLFRGGGELPQSQQ
jgi:hypothetical protein